MSVFSRVRWFGVVFSLAAVEQTIGASMTIRSDSRALSRESYGDGVVGGFGTCGLVFGPPLEVATT